MKSHIITLAALLAIPAALSAQTESGPAAMEDPFMMSLNLGTNFNTGGNRHREVFGMRPDVCPQFDLRIHYPVSHGWSVFFNVGLSIYPMKTDNLLEGISTALANVLLPGFGSIHTSYTLGGSYLLQHGRWIAIPRAGIGWYHVKKGTGSPFTADGSSITIDRNITTPVLNPGISAGYRTSSICSLILDISYRCPLRASTATVTTVRDKTTVVSRFTSRSWGNDLTVAAGIQFQMKL